MKIEELFQKIEELHKNDPVKEKAGDLSVSRETLYSQRMVDKLSELIPGHNLSLAIAARCHHLRRWEINRKDFPEGVSGYLAWRKNTHEHQAKIADALMTEAGIPSDTREKVLNIIKKENITKDPDVQLIEDITCLVFIENYLEKFSRKYSERKLTNILRKTYAKMSGQGHQWLKDSKIPEAILPLMGKLEG